MEFGGDTRVVQKHQHWKCQNVITNLLVLGTPEHFELSLKLKNYSVRDRVILRRFILQNKIDQKAKQWSSAKVSLSDANRSTQRQFQHFWGILGV